MKKDFKVKSKNRAVLTDFIGYCIAHPEERFWQALRNWSGFEFIKVSILRDPEIGNDRDTFYFEGKDK